MLLTHFKPWLLCDPLYYSYRKWSMMLRGRDKRWGIVGHGMVWMQMREKGKGGRSLGRAWAKSLWWDCWVCTQTGQAYSNGNINKNKNHWTSRHVNTMRDFWNNNYYRKLAFVQHGFRHCSNVTISFVLWKVAWGSKAQRTLTH